MFSNCDSVEAELQKVQESQDYIPVKLLGNIYVCLAMGECIENKLMTHFVSQSTLSTIHRSTHIPQAIKSTN